MTVRAHLFPVALIAFAIIASAFGQMTQADQRHQAVIPRSIASGDVDRGELSVRTAENFDFPRVLPTPVASIPVPIPLPPPAPRPGIVLAPNTVMGNGYLAWPVRGPITTYFSSGHQAIDIGVRCGTPVFSSMNGTVTFAGWKNNGGGYVIEVAGADGFFVSYDHLSEVRISPGNGVGKGNNIGASGATGWSTGCHLHFGVYINGVPVNPLLYL